MIATRRLGGGFLLLAVCLGRPSPARAEEPAALFQGGKELLAQARELWREGTRAYRKGNLERARLLYLSAFRAQRHYQIAGSLGHVEIALGRYRDGAEHVSYYLRETRDLPSASPRDRAMMEQDLATAQARVGVLAITVEPRGASVLVDGSLVGRSPLPEPVFVDPGRHVVEARVEGHRPIVEARELAPGSRSEIAIRLSPVAPPPPPKRAVAVAPPPLRPVPTRPARPIERVEGTMKDPVVITGAAVTVVGIGVGAALTGWWASLESGSECMRAIDPGPCEREWASVKTASVWTLTSASVTGLGTLAYALVARRMGAPARRPVSIGKGSGPGSIAIHW
jgi:hypothetical protein